MRESSYKQLIRTGDVSSRELDGHDDDAWLTLNSQNRSCLYINGIGSCITVEGWRIVLQ